MKALISLKRIITLCILFVSCSTLSQAKVSLPKLISDGMVLQRNTPLLIWGSAEPGDNIYIKFKKKKYETVADANGKWRINLPEMKAGGPYSMQINDIVLNDILIGDVYLCSGQSNMELPVNRVMDKFASEVNGYENNSIRYVKVPYSYDFSEKQDDVKTVSWKAMNKENFMGYSAICYFFSRIMQEKTGVPVGIINSSWGGTPVEAWISEEGLKDFPAYINQKAMYEDNELVALIKKMENERGNAWRNQLYRSDAGIHSDIPWYSEKLDDSEWEKIDMFSSEWASLNGRPINGTHWFRKDFDIPESWNISDAVLRLGCIVDADSVFVNGHFVGSVSYQYPPRIYTVPSELLKHGKNQITIRLFSNGGYPSFVQDKPYKLICGDNEVDLTGIWKHKTGSVMPSAPSSTGFQNVPVGLYNGMIFPLRNYKFKGIVWYQGESNVGRWNEYSSLLSAMIADWRKLFDSQLPFYIIELADFLAPDNPGRSAWAALRKQQAITAEKNPDTYLIKNSDIGEWNDIHPLDKKTAAIRLVDTILNNDNKKHK